MHSAWTRGRISSLHCQLDTAPWIKLLFFRLLGMLYGEKYISASKAFSKWRQSIKPARKKQSLVMVAFCSFTAFASSVIWVEEWGFHMHAGEADSISTLLVLEKSSSARGNSCWQTEQLPLSRSCQDGSRMSGSSEHPDLQQNLPSACPAPLPLLQPFVSSSLQGNNTQFYQEQHMWATISYFFILPQKRADNTITDATERNE